ADRGRFNRESYIVSSQAATYCESLSETTAFVTNSMRNYEACQDMISTLPGPVRTTLEGKRRQASLYMAALHQGVEERTNLASARTLVALVAVEEARVGEARRPAEIARLTTARDAALARLPVESRNVVNIAAPNAEQMQAIRTRANTIERRIIGILAGTERIEGVDAGWVATRLYLDVLEARYTQIQDQQRAFVRDRRHEQEGGRPALELLNRERQSVMAQMVAYTNDLTGYQMHMAQLSTTQRLFGTRVNLEGALQSPPAANEETRRDINRSAREMRDFHLDRISAVTAQANIEFGGGLLTRERIRDGLVRSTITAANISAWVSRVLTLNGNVDLGGRVQNFLAGPICEALGWPRDAEGRFKTELTNDEKETIIDRFGRLTDTLQNFNRNNNGARIRDTVTAIKALDPTEAVSADRIGQVREPLPEGEVTAAQVPAKLAELERTYGNRQDAVATLHAVLLRQLNGQWGTLDASGRSGTGFIGQYSTMLFEIERMIGIQLDVAGACFQMQRNMFHGAGAAIIAVATSPITLSLTPVLAIAAMRYGSRAVTGTARFIRWQGQQFRMATPFQRVGYGAAVATDAYRLYETYQEIGQENERLNDVKGQIAAQLVLAGFVRQGATDTYTHACGSRITLSELNQGLDEQRRALYLRGGAQAIGLGGLLLMGPRLAMGPAGWALIGIQVTVEAGIAAWDNRNARDLIANPNTPPWLLVALGADRLVNRSEYSMLVNSSSWNFLFTSTAETKQAVRDKMYFTIFGQELGAASPELYREIMAGMRNVGQIDGLFNGDFKSFMMPYVYVRLFQKTRGRGSSVSWDSVKEGRVDRGWVVIPPDVTNLDIREAMREVGVLYVQHMREKRYVALWRQRATLQREADAAPADREKRARLSDCTHMLELMGEERVLGQPLRTLTPEFLDAPGEKTRPQLLMEAIFGQVNGNPGAANFRLNAAAVAGIRGLPAGMARDGVDFSSGDALLPLGISDEAALLNMRRIGPLTTDEPAGRVFPEWNDWGAQGRRLLTLPSGIDEATEVHANRTVANNVSAGAGLPNVAADASVEAARDRITEGAVAMFNRENRRFTRDDRLASDLYSRHGSIPPVFTNLDARLPYNGDRQRRLMLNNCLPDQGGVFEIRNAKAVFIESRTLPSGHDVVLFTFVYGDVQSIGVRNSRVYVLQQGIGTSRTGTSDNVVRGRAVGYNELGIRAQRGGATMLNETIVALQRQDLQIARVRHEDQEREARERPIREARERAEREAATRETTARTERIRVATERMRANPNTFIAIENADGRGSRFHMRYRDGTEDKVIILNPYTVNREAGVRAAPSGELRDPELTTSISVDGTATTIGWNLMRDNAISYAQQRMYLRVLTTALPGETGMPFDRIISMFPMYDSLSIDVRGELRTLYDAATDKQGFLYYLLTVAGGRGGFTSATNRTTWGFGAFGSNDNDIVKWFRDNASMFETAGRAGDFDRMVNGHRLMGTVLPDGDGVWWRRDGGSGTPIGYRFLMGSGWQWTPDTGRANGSRRWMATDDPVVRGSGTWEGRAPLQGNIDFMGTLPR
ncbi:MAG: hypothetical protein KBC95_00565, partial [Candidatus Peribacteraceae bacterium]|nr:hypothetical protein [Candidatus Peribacteraceae bacterium]